MDGQKVPTWGPVPKDDMSEWKQSSLQAGHLATGWYGIEVTADGSGLPTEERYWDGSTWGDTRPVTEETLSRLSREDRISLGQEKGWGDERLGDDPHWDPATADSDGDGISDAEELAATEQFLKRRQ